MRTTYVFRDGRLVEKRYEPCRAVSSLPAPMIILDTIAPFFSHADGKTYDSKSNYYRVLKHKGLRIVENSEPQIPKRTPPSPMMPDVIEAYKKVRDGYKPEPLITESEAQNEIG